MQRIIEPSKVVLAVAALAMALGICPRWTVRAQPQLPDTEAIVIAGIGAGAGGIGMEPPPTSPPELVAPASGRLLANGVLLLRTDANFTPVVELRPQGMDVAPLGGTLARFEEYWIWTPLEPPAQGSYELLMTNEGQAWTETRLQLEVVAAITLQPPLLTAEPSVSWVSTPTIESCCRDRSAGQWFAISCFLTAEMASAQLHLGLASMSPVALLEQHLFRVAATTREGPPSFDATYQVWSQLPSSLWFDNQASEYCFAIEALELVTQTVRSYASMSPTGLSPSCAAHGDLPSLEPRTIPPSASNLDRLVCPTPPEGLEMAWCELHEDGCKDPLAPGCRYYGYVCEGAPLPSDGAEWGTGGMPPIGGAAGLQAGTGGSAAEGGTAEAAGSGGLAGVAASDSSSPSRSRSCSVSPAIASSGLDLGGWLALAALTLSRVRRGKRRGG